MKKAYNLIFIFLVIVNLSCEQFEFDYSQNESNILFISRRIENSAAWKLITMNNDGSQQKSVTDLTVRCEKPSLSPSGQTVLFVHYSTDNFYELYSVGINGSNLKLIDRAKRYCGSMNWSNNGSKIIYSISRNDSTDEKDLILFDINTKNKTKLTSNGNNSSATFSIDDKIAYCSRYDSYSCSDIYTMNIDGSNKQLIQSCACNPVWSPDGTKIAYQKSVDNGSSQIFVCMTDGSNMKQLTSTYSSQVWPGWPPDGNFDPNWTPDGNNIVYVSWQQDNPDIFIMDQYGSNIRQLTNSDKRDENPSITKNGRFILFSSNRNIDMNSEVFIMDIYGINQTPLTNFQGSDIYPIEVIE
ncbi:MAG: DUF5050 domain-containing protein [Cyclobacteriaceae bacterium]|nr:DUF5050 domain-containing protein [Cyclobacteriaceae bacterium]